MPRANDSCPCGSGVKYKRCDCNHRRYVPPPPPRPLTEAERRRGRAGLVALNMIAAGMMPEALSVMRVNAASEQGRGEGE